MIGLLPPLLQPIAAPASLMYRRLMARRNARFDQGIAVCRIDRPVISVGNMTVGGTGKSPMVRWLAQTLSALGRRPLIIMRGYGARNGQPSDEHAEHRDALKEIDVVASPDRVAALRNYLPDHPEIDCVIMDDGFQHRYLHRDLDLVLIDASRDTMHDRLIPAGRLREPLENLRRADAVIVTRAAEHDDAFAAAIEQYHGRPPIAWSQHAWTGVNIHHGSARHAETQPVSWLRGKTVVTMLGVGHPGALREQVRLSGATIAGDIPVRDHQAYDRRLLRAAVEQARTADALLVTQKDWVKVSRLLDSVSVLPETIVVPDLAISFWRGEDALRRMIADAVSSFED